MGHKQAAVERSGVKYNCRQGTLELFTLATGVGMAEQVVLQRLSCSPPLLLGPLCTLLTAAVAGHASSVGEKAIRAFSTTHPSSVGACFIAFAVVASRLAALKAATIGVLILCLHHTMWQ